MDRTGMERIMAAGVVGAGGAGFPTHIKLNNKAGIVIANGVECEPLLRADRLVMENYPEKVADGLRIAMDICGAERGVICLKGKNRLAVERLTKAVENMEKLSLHLLESYYPAGDEQQILYEVTGKVVPPGGLPISIGAVVLNVSTLAGISEALRDIPVTNRLVTVAGEVKNPVTLNAPIGTPLKELVAIAGGPGESGRYAMLVGGPVMGRVEENWSEVVRKTTGGIIILPSEHRLIVKKAAALQSDYRLAKSVCCQCGRCTQLCPRNLLGLGAQPHRAMLALAYDGAASLRNVNTVLSCCDCGICTYFACDMGLSPNKIVMALKQSLAKKGLKPGTTDRNSGVSHRRAYGKIPSHRLIERLGLARYDVDAPLVKDELKVKRVRLLLKQHIGAPARPLVAEGGQVKKGQLIGGIDGVSLGANVHASITGEVTRVNEEFIEITAD